MKYALLLLMLLQGFLAKAQHVAVETDKINSAYVGEDNPITVVSGNYTCDQLVVKTDNGTLKGNGCTYTYRPERPGMAKITVYARTGRKQKQISVQNIRVKKMPLPEISLAGKRAGNLSLAELQNCTAPACIPGVDDFDIQYTVTGCSIKIIQHITHDIILNKTYTNKNGAVFNDDIYKTFSNLHTGDQIIIYNITVMKNNDQMPECESIRFLVNGNP